MPENAREACGLDETDDTLLIKKPFDTLVMQYQYNSAKVKVIN